MAASSGVLVTTPASAHSIFKLDQNNGLALATSMTNSSEAVNATSVKCNALQQRHTLTAKGLQPVATRRHTRQKGDGTAPLTGGHQSVRLYSVPAAQ